MKGLRTGFDVDVHRRSCFTPSRMLRPEIDVSAKPFSAATLTVSLRTLPVESKLTVPYFADQVCKIVWRGKLRD